MNVHDSKILTLHLKVTENYCSQHKKSVYRFQRLEYREDLGRERDQELKSTRLGWMLVCFIHVFKHSSSYLKGSQRQLLHRLSQGEMSWVLSFHSKFPENRIQWGPRFGKEFPLSKQLETDLPVQLSLGFKSLLCFVPNIIST